MFAQGDSEQYARLLSLLSEARELDGAGRASLLAQLAQAEPELARELAALLRHGAGAAPQGVAPEAMEETRRQLAELTATRPGALAEGVVPAPGAPSPAAAAPAGIQFPAQDLELLSTLAEGGMGRVMLARQRSLHRDVAVKVLKQGRASPALVSGLLEEAVVTGSLEHPNIVPVHALGVDAQGLPLLVMKRVEGVPWSTLIDEPDHDAWARAPGGAADRLGAHLSILMSVCNAVSYAHSRGVLHLDIKPQNVMVGAFGEVYLVDWGIATRVPEDGSGGAVELPGGGLIGTPAFLAPEMASDGPRRLDVRTDVYLLGATLHYALTRTTRHGGRTAIQRIMQAQRSAPVDYGPEVPEELAALCNRATALDPAARPAGPAELRAALSDYLRHRGATELADGAAARLRQLRVALGREAPAPLDPRALHDLMSECQFGFEESLRAWPEGPRAASGLRECLELLLRYELEQENLARAQALLGKLGSPPAELAAAVAALAERVAARAAREAALREIERQRDWTTGARPRAAFLVAAFALAIAVWRLALGDGVTAAPGGALEMSPERMALYLAIGVALVCVVVAALRRLLFQTAVTRGLVLGMLCCFFAMLASRALQLLPAPQTAATVSADQLLLATTAAVGAVTLAPWLWLAAPVFLGGAILCRVAPALAGESLAATLGIGLLLFLAALSRASAAARSKRMSSGSSSP